MIRIGSSGESIDDAALCAVVVMFAALQCRVFCTNSGAVRQCSRTLAGGMFGAERMLNVAGLSTKTKDSRQTLKFLRNAGALRHHHRLEQH